MHCSIALMSFSFSKAFGYRCNEEFNLSVEKIVLDFNLRVQKETTLVSGKIIQTLYKSEIIQNRNYLKNNKGLDYFEEVYSC